MRPLLSSITVEVPRERVFAFLDVMANHKLFTDHYMVDWTFSGPDRGVGASVRLRPTLPGAGWLTITTTQSEAPEFHAEESTDDSGKRRNRGTYTLREVAGGTEIRFQFEQLRRPFADKLLTPITRRWMRRANDRALERLATLLHSSGG